MGRAISKILLIDDDHDDHHIFLEAIQQTANNVVCIAAYDGGEALKILTELPVTELPDLILLDINMPKVNGIDCLMAVKKSEKLKVIPVMMYSTSSTILYQKICFKAGASAYMEKPNDFKNLCNKLSMILSTDSDILQKQTVF